jgi:hypothetical protein
MTTIAASIKTALHTTATLVRKTITRIEKIEGKWSGMKNTNHFLLEQMDHTTPAAKRNKKSDKAKKTFELKGAFSQKHIRLLEALKEKQK